MGAASRSLFSRLVAFFLRRKGPNYRDTLLMPELSIAEDKTFRTGDRLSWVSRSRDGVLDEPPPRTAHIEFSCPVRIIAMSVRPRIASVQPHIAPGPVPILFSTLSPNASSELVQVVYQECCKFGLPRSWSPEDVTET
jgi:hypothetical protein